ncbi:MAG: BREX-1 system adenine-specific DNA-methyltransferase PglX, partial [Dehalococcoidia bacterium]|nr:BREX-1 system adenine-specific DNA-methyltransferase PglX [Dehalococcoidia bacterium]
SNEKLSKEYAKAVLAGQGKEFLEEFKRSTGVPGAPPAPQVPKTKEEALKRKQELQKQLEELRALERSLR